jgi:YihY family inner membrane protein
MNIFERTLRRVDAVQQRHTGPAFAYGVVKKFGDDNAGALAVQLAYSMFVTVFPLLLLLVTVLGLVLADDPSLRQRVLNSAFGQFPVIGQQLATNLHAIRRSSAAGIGFGIFGLIYGSTGVAQTGLYAMEQVWNIPSAIRPNYLIRLERSLIFLVVLAVGLIVTTVLSGFGTFGRHNFWLGVLGELLAFGANVGMYLAGFRVLTPRQIATRRLIPGAIFGGAAWTVLQAAGGYVVGHDLKGSSAIYGTFGLVLGLVAWLYLGAKITLYAAEMNTVLYHRLWPRGIVQPPLTEADQKSLAFQATQNQRRPEQTVETRFRERPMTQDEYRARGYRTDDSVPGIVRKSPDDVAVPAGESGSEPAVFGQGPDGDARW